ncbi:hypothetical protein J6590_002965 [Homalodisca vitripennis]|nr:hypothetical protein J6590_002965 [Homalodisca vitripennis]
MGGSWPSQRAAGVEWRVELPRSVRETSRCGLLHASLRVNTNGSWSGVIQEALYIRVISQVLPDSGSDDGVLWLDLPHLTYGVVLWGATSNNQLMKVFKLKKRAIRISESLEEKPSIKLQLFTLPSSHFRNNSVLFV